MTLSWASAAAADSSTTAVRRTITFCARPVSKRPVLDRTSANRGMESLLFSKFMNVAIGVRAAVFAGQLLQKVVGLQIAPFSKLDGKDPRPAVVAFLDLFEIAGIENRLAGVGQEKDDFRAVAKRCQQGIDVPRPAFRFDAANELAGQPPIGVRTPPELFLPLWAPHAP